MSAAIEARGLAIHVGGRTLVQQLSLQVRPGELWAVLGANGAGKTLLLDTLAGLRPASRGSIDLAGRPLPQWPALEIAKRRAFLPQAVHDAFSASVLDVVLLGRHPHMSRWGWEGEAERRMAVAALQAVEMDGLAARDVVTLSGGERRRVAIAALLVQDAPLALLDEPVAHLDLHHQIAILERLAALVREQGKAVMLSVHDLNLAARFATHALLFRGDGRVDLGPLEAVMSDAALSSAFRYPVARATLGGRSVFLPG
ncbi:MAG: ABC transporter ATP-binding protein [Usitatibacter sp.]